MSHRSARVICGEDGTGTKDRELSLVKASQPEPGICACIESLEQASGLIFQAKKPLILAGHSSYQKSCVRSNHKVCRTVKDTGGQYHDGKRNHSVTPVNTLYGPSEFLRKIIRIWLLEEADLVIAIGYDIVEYAPSQMESA